ncbi:MAG: hypothetical protein ACI3X6_06165 [Alloprevotella sp.]
MKNYLFAFCAAMIFCFAACETNDGDELNEDSLTTDTPPSQGDDGGGGDIADVREDVVCRAEYVGGFKASLCADSETLPSFGNSKYQGYSVEEHGVKVSNLPFEANEMFSGNLSIREFCGVSFSEGNYEIWGLRPEQHYYVRNWYRLKSHNDGSQLIVSSNLVTIDTPAASWFATIHVNTLSIKDTQIAVSLSPYIMPEWNGYKISGGYDIERGKCQMQATYKKLSPEYETWKDTDTPTSGIEIKDDGTNFLIELHNLQPGEEVRVRPWIDVDGKRYEAEWQAFKSYELATSGYVQSGYCQWAACNLGASMPYEIGTLYEDPDTALDSNSEAVVPTVQMWEMLMNSSWVCGTLQGVEGWFVMNNEREASVWTIFLPFTKEYEDDGSLAGDYWTSTSFHPDGAGAGFMVTNYFHCLNTPNLLQHQYATGFYMETNGKYKLPIRTVKFLD